MPPSTRLPVSKCCFARSVPSPVDVSQHFREFPIYNGCAFRSNLQPEGAILSTFPAQHDLKRNSTRTSDQPVACPKPSKHMYASITDVLFPEKMTRAESRVAALAAYFTISCNNVVVKQERNPLIPRAHIARGQPVVRQHPVSCEVVILKLQHALVGGAVLQRKGVVWAGETAGTRGSANHKQRVLAARKKNSPIFAPNLFSSPISIYLFFPPPPGLVRATRKHTILLETPQFLVRNCCPPWRKKNKKRRTLVQSRLAYKVKQPKTSQIGRAHV